MPKPHPPHPTPPACCAGRGAHWIQLPLHRLLQCSVHAACHTAQIEGKSTWVAASDAVLCSATPRQWSARDPTSECKVRPAHRREGGASSSSASCSPASSSPSSSSSWRCFVERRLRRTTATCRECSICNAGAGGGAMLALRRHQHSMAAAPCPRLLVTCRRSRAQNASPSSQPLASACRCWAGMGQQREQGSSVKSNRWAIEWPGLATCHCLGSVYAAELLACSPRACMGTVLSSQRGTHRTWWISTSSLQTRAGRQEGGRVSQLLLLA